MVQAVFYKPVGHCIYCGMVSALPDQSDLTDEHIVPYALGGFMELPKASCRVCAGVTSAFEGKVSRAMYGNLRNALGYPSYRKKNKPRMVAIPYRMPDGTEGSVEFPVREVPAAYSVLDFDPPGVLVGRPPHQGNPPMKTSIGFTGTQEELNAFTAKMPHGAEWANATTALWWPLSRTLAKIAHAYLVAECGTAGYLSLLKDVILGTDDVPSHLVGGQPGFFGGTIGNPLEGLAIMPQLIEDGRQALVVNIALMHGKLPNYQVVAALVTNGQVIERVRDSGRRDLTRTPTDYNPMFPYWDVNYKGR